MLDMIVVQVDLYIDLLNMIDMMFVLIDFVLNQLDIANMK
jgi:hypothetical protein